MAEEKSGALSGDEGDKKEADTPKTFTQDEFDAAVKDADEKATAKATSDSYRKHQSAIDTAKASSDKAEEELNKVKREAIKNLPEAERQAAMLEDVFEKLNNPAPKAGAKGEDDLKPAPVVDSPESAQAEAQKKLREIAKAKGLDPDKLDFSDPEKFIDGIKEQLKESETEEDEDDDPIDTTTGSVGGKSTSREAMLKADPKALMRQGYKDRKRVGRNR